MSAVPAFRPESSQGTEDSGLIGLSLRGLPLPATIRLANPLSDEDLLAFCQANRGLEIGSEADGSIVIMTPAAPESSELTQFLATSSRSGPGNWTMA